MKSIILFLIVFFSSSISIFASGFHLSSIGGVETNGIQGGKWWHTSNQPTLIGEGSPGSVVDITIDGTAYQANVNSDADWSFTPPALADGDHQLSFSNQGSTFSLTLVTGKANVDWDAVEKGTGSTLPTVGTTWPTFILILLGITGISFGINSSKR